MKYKIVRLALAATVMVSVSSCGIFSKGCKCPSVHRQKAVALTADPSSTLQRFGNGNRTHAGSPVFQQGAGTGLERSAGRQHIVNQ